VREARTGTERPKYRIYKRNNYWTNNTWRGAKKQNRFRGRMEKYAHTQRERKKRMPPIHRSKNRLGNNPQTVVH